MENGAAKLSDFGLSTENKNLIEISEWTKINEQ